MATFLRIFVALIIAVPVSQAATTWTNSFANVNVRTNLKAASTLTTNLVMATNTASRVQYLDGSSGLKSVTHTGIVLGTGAQYPSGSYTVAALPAAASYPGAVLYCSDMLTPNGTGGTVFSDGTNWRSTITRIVATTDLQTFMLGSTAVQWLGRGTLMYTLQGEYLLTATGTPKFNDFDAITTTGTISPSSDTGWDGVVFSTSTSATAHGAIFGGYYTPTNADWIVMSVTLRLRNSLSSDAEQYWVQVGSSPTSAAYGTSHSGFLYDPHNVNGHGITGAATNNWLVFDQAAGVLTNIVNTGVLATTNFTTFTRVVNGTNSWGYINGTVVSTNAAGPTIVTIPFIAKIAKAVGTTARLMDIKNAYMATRRGTAESTYP